MARPICWECGRQLQYHNGKPVFKEYTDEAGNTHKLHKACYEYEGYGDKQVTAKEKEYGNIQTDS
jgi:hypothetical protein